MELNAGMASVKQEDKKRPCFILYIIYYIIYLGVLGRNACA